MATGKSSNHGASSSTTKTAKKQEKRKQCATPTRAMVEAKKPRPFQLLNFPAPHPRVRSAVPAGVPHHRGAINNMAAAAALPFPMAGVNGAAPLWSTAAALGAASRAAALTLSSLPATTTTAAAAAAPVVIAPATAMQPPPPASAASSNAAAAALPAPLVLAQAGAGGQLVPMPLHFVGYHPTCGGSAIASGLLPAPAVGIPLAAALDKMENGALGRMLSALTPACHPPLLRQHHQGKTGGARAPPPPWWPTGAEDWWGPELLAHLDLDAAAATATAPVPFASSYSLRKPQKVALLVAVVKHLAPDFARIAAAVWHSAKLSASETRLWHCALNHERAKFMRPVFLLLPQPQQQGGAAAGTDPSSAGSVVVHGGSAAPDSDGRDQPVNFPAGGEGYAAVAAAPAGTGHVGHVVAGGPEMAMQQPETEPEQHGGVPGNGVAGAEDDEVQDHPVVDVEVGSHQWWHDNEAIDRMFAEFEAYGDIWY